MPAPSSRSEPVFLRRPSVAIFAVSFLVLFFELVVIRWLSSEIQVFSWLKNLPLMVAFLGLGLGNLSTRVDRTVSLRFLWLFAAFAFVLLIADPLRFDHIAFPDPSITTWHAPDPSVASWWETRGPGATLAVFVTVVLVVSVLVTAMFALLGATLGATMNTTRPLAAYSANVLGSLAGVLAFTALSFLQTPPFAWVVVALVIAVPLVPRSRMAPLPIAFTLVFAFLPSLRADVLWSPYYRVAHSPIAGSTPPVGYTITVNHQYHQQAVGLSDEALRRHPGLAELRAEYELPFVLAPRHEIVALLGAGTGNDASAALRQGAQRVVAVEIDPAIIELGHRLHDEQPYSSPKVHVVNTDARAWLRQSDDRFDVISFGLVDSHTMLSSMSSLRLESYLYTVESIRDVMRLLKPDGVAAMSFVIADNDWQGQRLFNTIQQATGSPPIVINMPNYGQSYIFGPGARPDAVSAAVASRGFPVVTQRYEGTSVWAATDNWPFLYLNPTQQPVGYLLMLFGLLVASFFSIRSRLHGDGGMSRLNAQMFFMGAAFLLIETKSIAELSLLFGSTWVVNAAVFSAILTMVLAANAIVGRFSVGDVKQGRVHVFYALLLLSLVLAFFFPVSALNSFGLVERAVIGSLLSALPIAFSGVIFATAFSAAPRASTALGWNLFGAIVGGVLEASSMWFGIKSLSLLAAALYVLSWVAVYGPPYRAKILAGSRAAGARLE